MIATVSHCIDQNGQEERLRVRSDCHIIRTEHLREMYTCRGWHMYLESSTRIASCMEYFVAAKSYTRLRSLEDKILLTAFDEFVRLKGNFSPTWSDKFIILHPGCLPVTRIFRCCLAIKTGMPVTGFILPSERLNSISLTSCA